MVISNSGNTREYLSLDKLDVYVLSRELSKVGWKIYSEFDWRTKKIIGDQFIESTDSVGANVAEGYGRFHYLDKIKFYYNARGSLKESRHWFELMTERNLVKEDDRKEYLKTYSKLSPKINGLINSAYKCKTRDRS